MRLRRNNKDTGKKKLTSIPRKAPKRFLKNICQIDLKASKIFFPECYHAWETQQPIQYSNWRTDSLISNSKRSLDKMQSLLLHRSRGNEALLETTFTLMKKPTSAVIITKSFCVNLVFCSEKQSHSRLSSRSPEFCRNFVPCPSICVVTARYLLSVRIIVLRGLHS